VTPKVGYTKSTGDAVCTNGYRICSPTTLFWSCNTQGRIQINFIELPWQKEFL
jgi:hypothetical protein